MKHVYVAIYTEHYDAPLILGVCETYERAQGLANNRMRRTNDQNWTMVDNVDDDYRYAKSAKADLVIRKYELL